MTMRPRRFFRVAATVPAAAAAAVLGSMGTLAWGVASATDVSGLYLAADALHTFGTYDRAAFDAAVTSAVESSTGTTLTLDSSSTRHDSATWSAAVGYRASPFFAVEASYLDVGQVRYEATGTENSLFGPSPLTTSVKVSSRGPALSLIGILPLLDALEVDGRVGAYEGKTKTDYSNDVAGTAYTGSESKTSTTLLLGAGVDYAFTGHWALRLGYIHLNHVDEKFFGRSFNVDLASAGLTFVF